MVANQRRTKTQSKTQVMWGSKSEVRIEKELVGPRRQLKEGLGLPK